MGVPVEDTPRASEVETRVWATGLGTLTAGDLRTLVPAFAALALFGAWSAVDGGFSPTWWLPGGLLMAGLALVSVIGGGSNLARLPRLQLIAVGAFAALTAWSYCSLVWAEVTGDAWDGANRTLLYLLVLCLFASLPWRTLTVAVVLAGYVVAVTGVGVVWFLQVVSEPSARDFMGGRLANPTGYQNANAALFMMALWPALVVGSRRGAPVVLRALALATATFLAQLAFLCQSRGALFAVPVLVLAMLVLVPGRLRTSVAVALPLVAIALAREPLLDVYAAGESRPRLAEALPGAAWAMLASVAAVGVAGALWGLVDRRLVVPVRLSRALGVGILAAAFVIAAFAVPRLDVGDRLDRGWTQFTGKAAEPTPRRGSSYLAFGLSGNRYDLWSVGMRQFRARPIVGEGVDNFAVAYLRERRFDEEPHYPHSVELRMLGGLGLVGAGLFLVFVVAILAAAVRPRGLTDTQRAIACAATLPFLWWLVHGSVDWLWEFPALSGPALAFVVLAGALRRGSGDAPEPRRGTVASVGSLAVIVLAAVSAAAFVPTWLAARHVQAAQGTWRSDPAAAYRSLESARQLNPFSDNPDVVLGAIASRLHEDARARAAFARAFERNPRNWYTAMELGLFESVAGRPTSALRYLARAQALNPLEGLLPLLAERVRAGERIHPSSLDRLFLEETEGLVT